MQTQSNTPYTLRREGKTWAWETTDGRGGYSATRADAENDARVACGLPVSSTIATDALRQTMRGGLLRVQVGSDFERLIRPLSVIDGDIEFEYANGIYRLPLSKLQPIGQP